MLYILILSLALSASSFVTVDYAGKCSAKRNNEVLCAYWGADSDGGLAQKATAYLNRTYSLHGVWGLESLPPPTRWIAPVACNTGVKPFTDWYCNTMKPVTSMIEPGDYVNNYTACINNNTVAAHAYHECLCHSAHVGQDQYTWYKYLQNCSDPTIFPTLYTISCRFDKLKQCNYVQEWATYDYTGGKPKGCRGGYQICNPIHQISHFTSVYLPNSCFGVCPTKANAHKSPYIDIVGEKADEDITDAPPDDSTSDDGKAQWPHHSNITAFEWTMIAIGILVFIIIFSILIIVICLCHNGRIRRNPAPDFIVAFKSYFRRSLLALKIEGACRHTFNGPKENFNVQFIIGGTREGVGYLTTSFKNIGDDFKEKNKNGDTIWSWKFPQRLNKLSLNRYFGNSKKLRISWNCVEKQVGRIDSISSIAICALNDSYVCNSTTEIYKNSSASTVTGNKFNPFFASLNNSDKNRVRSYFVRRYGNADIIYNQNKDATNSIRQASELTK